MGRVNDKGDRRGENCKPYFGEDKRNYPPYEHIHTPKIAFLDVITESIDR